MFAEQPGGHLETAFMSLAEGQREEDLKRLSSELTVKDKLRKEAFKDAKKKKRTAKKARKY